MKVSSCFYLLLIFLFIGFPYCLKGQIPTFIARYSTDWDEVATHSIETGDGGFIVSARQDDWGLQQFHVLLLRLNKWGDTLKSTTIFNTAGNCFISQLIRSDDGNYFGMGTYQQSPDEMSVWLIKLDNNLEILWEKLYQTGCYNLALWTAGLIDHERNLILTTNGDLYPVPSNALIVLRCSQDGDSLDGVKLTQPSHYAWVTDIAEKADSSGFIMTIDGKYLINTWTFGQILTIDTLFNLKRTDTIPGDLYMYYNVVTPGNKVLVTGMRTFNGTYPKTVKAGILQLDTLFQVNKMDYFGPQDTMTYPGYSHGLSMADSMNIFYGGVKNQDKDLWFSPKKTWFMLTKFDINLNVKWQKFYGGDQNYGLFSVAATSDGGCLMSGFSYNYLTQQDERDILLIKVDTLGIVTGGSLQEPFPVHDMIVYPNPGSDHLIIEAGPQVHGSRFILFDSGGGQVISRELNQLNLQLSTGSLPPGIYIWQLVIHNRVIDSGKWAKIQ